MQLPQFGKKSTKAATEAQQEVGDSPTSHSLLKLFLLAMVDALVLRFAYALAQEELIPGAISIVAVAIVLNWVFLSERMRPWRWIAPGFLTMLLIVVYPLVYTLFIAFTNYGDGHLINKQQAIEQLERQPAITADTPRYEWTAYRNGAGEYLIWLKRDGQDLLLSPGEPSQAVRPVDFNASEGGLPASIEDYVQLTKAESVRFLTELENLTFRSEGRTLTIESLNAAVLAPSRYQFDPASNAMVDTVTGTVYTVQEGIFTAPDGSRLTPGFTSAIGWENFVRVFTDPQIQAPFFRVFIWTFVFALLSVMMTFTVGLGLAIVLNDPQLPLRGILRSLIIAPYTIPGFISILVWVGLLNPFYGQVNLLLEQVTGVSPEWFSNPTLAKVAILLVNTWLGYPYMLIISLGALQSIPSELYEASSIDGASAWQQFRHITLPILLVSVGPLLIGAFAFNFNNFSVIELVTEGGPPIPGYATPAGHTDILISYTYRLAFSGGRGTEYGFAAAISLFIFLIIAVITAFNFRFTRALEEVSENV